MLFLGGCGKCSQLTTNTNVASRKAGNKQDGVYKVLLEMARSLKISANLLMLVLVLLRLLLLLPPSFGFVFGGHTFLMEHCHQH